MCFTIGTAPSSPRSTSCLRQLSPRSRTARQISAARASVECRCMSGCTGLLLKGPSAATSPNWKNIVFSLSWIHAAPAGSAMSGRGTQAMATRSWRTSSGTTKGRQKCLRNAGGSWRRRSRPSARSPQRRTNPTRSHRNLSLSVAWAGSLSCAALHSSSSASSKSGRPESFALRHRGRVAPASQSQSRSTCQLARGGRSVLLLPLRVQRGTDRSQWTFRSPRAPTSPTIVKSSGSS
mmetsp:Transcript_114546/g.286253  ORF Transcript_114546/g.286253 Transcript_114546/m.286253 type:complete len:236 (+) Transcript_114546:1753-2460(+)